MKTKIGITKDSQGWFHKFEIAISKLDIKGMDIDAQIVDLDCADFPMNIEKMDAILWHPGYMGLRLASHFKEKVYFMEKMLGKMVFPSYDTIWHFESKIAQNYIFNLGEINTPKTHITFNYYNAIDIIHLLDMPVVLKKSEGAASKNVKLIHNKKWLLDYAQKVFCDQLWAEARCNHSKVDLLLHYSLKKWFWNFILSQIYHSDNGMGVIYLQEFIPNNDADLRITVIGDKYAYGFWRNNRSGDFRASGSGNIDYKRDIPIEALLYCQNINRKYNFDSMAYDILFRGNDMLINEMSYGYVDKALYNAPGYYEIGDEIKFIAKNTWPQELWVSALINRIQDING